MSNPIFDHLHLKNRFNVGDNVHLYAACRVLFDGERKLDGKWLFQSLYRTLNHIPVLGSIWIARLEELEALSTGFEQDTYTDFTGMHLARVVNGTRMNFFTNYFDGGYLKGVIAYLNNDAWIFKCPHHLQMVCFFNQQVHPRDRCTVW